MGISQSLSLTRIHTGRGSARYGLMFLMNKKANALCDVLGPHRCPYPIGYWPVTIMHRTKDIAGMGKDANIEGRYYNPALPFPFLNLRTGGDLSCYAIVVDGDLYMDMNGKIDNTP